MLFCFYKPCQRIIRQQLYICIKYIPIKHNSILKIHSSENTTTLCAYIIKSVYLCISLCFNKICNSFGIKLLNLPGRLVLHYTPLHILASILTSTALIFRWHLVTNLFIIFQTFSMVFMSTMGIPLHSWNVLVL